MLENKAFNSMAGCPSEVRVVSKEEGEVLGATAASAKVVIVGGEKAVWAKEGKKAYLVSGNR